VRHKYIIINKLACKNKINFGNVSAGAGMAKMKEYGR